MIISEGSIKQLLKNLVHFENAILLITEERGGQSVTEKKYYEKDIPYFRTTALYQVHLFLKVGHFCRGALRMCSEFAYFANFSLMGT